MAKKNVLIEVNGDNKLMKLGFNGLVEIEELLGKSFMEVVNGEIKFTDLQAVFFVSLKHGGEKNLTFEATGEIMDDIADEHGMTYLTGKLEELFNNLMGSKEAQAPFLDTVN